MTESARRRILFAVPFACLLTIAATALAWAGELPDPVAIHWDLAGEADGFGPLWLSSAVFFVLVGVLGLGGLALQARVRGPSVRWVGATALGLSLYLTVLHVGTLWVNVGVADAARAGSPWVALVAGLVALVVGGALGWQLSPVVEGEGPMTLPTTELAVRPGEAVVWAGTATAETWLVVLAGVIVAGGAVLFLVAEPWAAAVLLLAGLGVASMFRVHVLVGPAGVLVRMGPFGVLRRTIALEDVASVSAELVEPLAYGGWGYRLLPGLRAIVVRSGPGLRITTTSGPDVVVTVDGAADAAGVLLAHLDDARVG